MESKRPKKFKHLKKLATKLTEGKVLRIRKKTQGSAITAGGGASLQY